MFFKWDRQQGSKDVQYHDPRPLDSDASIGDVNDDSSFEFVNEYLLPHRVSVKSGKNFKSVIGDQPMPSGGKYFFEILANKGYLMKVGVSRRKLDPEAVSFICDIIAFCRLSVIHMMDGHSTMVS